MATSKTLICTIHSCRILSLINRLFRIKPVVVVYRCDGARKTQQHYTRYAKQILDNPRWEDTCSFEYNLPIEAGEYLLFELEDMLGNVYGHGRIDIVDPLPHTTTIQLLNSKGKLVGNLRISPRLEEHRNPIPVQSRTSSPQPKSGGNDNKAFKTPLVDTDLWLMVDVVD